MKKPISTLIVLMLLLSLSVVVLAKNMDKPTDNYFKKQILLQKNHIKKSLKNNLISKSQAENMLKRLETMVNYYEKSNRYDHNRNYSMFRGHSMMMLGPTSYGVRMMQYFNPGIRNRSFRSGFGCRRW